MSNNWLDNVDPETKCWWMLSDYLRNTLKVILKRSDIGEFYRDNSLRSISFSVLKDKNGINDEKIKLFEEKLKADGIYNYIEIAYDKLHCYKNINTLDIKLKCLKKDEIEDLIGLFCLFGYTKALNDVSPI